MARLDRMAPVKEVANIGACIGRQFSRRLLSAVSRLGAEELDGALDQLLDSGLVFRRGSGPEATYVFKHALVQDVAHGTLLRSRRQQIHYEIAQAMLELNPERAESEPELLAQHFAEAGRVDRAIEFREQAGARAVARCANAEAVAHLRGRDRGAAEPAAVARARSPRAPAAGPAERAADRAAWLRLDRGRAMRAPGTRAERCARSSRPALRRAAGGLELVADAATARADLRARLRAHGVRRAERRSGAARGGAPGEGLQRVLPGSLFGRGGDARSGDRARRRRYPAGALRGLRRASGRSCAASTEAGRWRRSGARAKRRRWRRKGSLWRAACAIRTPWPGRSVAAPWCTPSCARPRRRCRSPKRRRSSPPPTGCRSGGRGRPSSPAGLEAESRSPRPASR